MFRPFSPSPHAWHLRRVRTLSLEHLESRVVLSGVPEVAATLPAVVTSISTDPSVLVATTSIVVDGSSSETMPPLNAAIDDTADAATALSQAASQIPTSLPSVASPALADNTAPGSIISEQTIDAIVSSSPQNMTPPSGGQAPGLPPWISSISAALENGIWRIHGSVLDDSSPAGLTVYFSGILNAQATTDEFGDFEFTIADSDLGVGWVYVHTVDANGLASDYERLTIDH